MMCEVQRLDLALWGHVCCTTRFRNYYNRMTAFYSSGWHCIEGNKSNSCILDVRSVYEGVARYMGVMT